jgi:hypothetical protein
MSATIRVVPNVCLFCQLMLHLLYLYVYTKRNHRPLSGRRVSSGQFSILILHHVHATPTRAITSVPRPSSHKTWEVDATPRLQMQI